MEDGTLPVLRFTCDFDERAAWEVELKGLFESAVAVLPNGLEIPLSFWDPVRLSQGISDAVKLGRVCFAEPGLVIIPKVTRENMERAIEELAADKFFDRLITLVQGGENSHKQTL
jgi:hypothetical protein